MKDHNIEQIVTELSHKKCKTIRNAQEMFNCHHEMEKMKSNSTKFGPKTVSNSNQCLSRMAFIFSTFSFLIVVVYMFIQLTQSYLNYRCQYFGGKKCYFPFDLFPDLLSDKQFSIVF